MLLIHKQINTFFRSAQWNANVGFLIDCRHVAPTDMPHGSPSADLLLYAQANGKHLFAAVFTQAKSTRGGLYLRQHLYSELLAQLTKQKGDVPAALHVAVDVLNSDYQSLNPASHHILQGLEMAVAFLEFKSSLLYVWSNGNCR